MTYEMDPGSPIRFSPYFLHTNPETLVGFQRLRFQHPRFAIRSYKPQDRDLYAKHKEIFLHDAASAVWYALKIGHDINTFRVALEEYITTVAYIDDVLPKVPRDPEVERYLLRMVNKTDSITPATAYATRYVLRVLREPWPEYEEELAKIDNADSLLRAEGDISEYAGVAYPTDRYSTAMKNLLDRIRYVRRQMGYSR